MLDTLAREKHNGDVGTDNGEKEGSPQGPWRDHFIVCGLGRFGLRIITLLRELGLPVVTITDASTRSDRVDKARELGASVIIGDFRFETVLEQACVRQARCVMLVAHTEVENMETALDVRRMAPSVRIVMRLGSDKIATRLRHDFSIEVLSPPVLAAREFARAVLDTPPPRPRPARPRDGESSLPRRLALDRANVNSVPAEGRLLGGFLITLFVLAIIVFQHHLDLSWSDAVYVTSSVMTTVGINEISLFRGPMPVRVFSVLLMFSGVTMISVLSSLLTNYLLSGSAAQQRAERVARSYRGHVILCGLGSVGFEVAEDLLARGIRVVVIDQTPGDVHFNNLSSRVPLLVGDATRPDNLVRAGAARARALIAATPDDAINLEIGLVAQSVVDDLRPDNPLRLVLRCFDPDLAHRIHAISDAYTLLSAAEISAPIFVARAMADD